MRAVKFYTLLFFLVLATSSSGQDSTLQEGDYQIFYVLHNLKGQMLRNKEAFSDSKKSFQLMAEYIKQHPNWIFEIGVHTDYRGNSNDKFSLFIAKNTIYELEYSFGIVEKRLIPKGYGERFPLISEPEIMKIHSKDARENAHSINRRYEIKAIKKVE